MNAMVTGTIFFGVAERAVLCCAAAAVLPPETTPVCWVGKSLPVSVASLFVLHVQRLLSEDQRTVVVRMTITFAHAHHFIDSYVCQIICSSLEKC